MNVWTRNTSNKWKGKQGHESAHVHNDAKLRWEETAEWYVEGTRDYTQVIFKLLILVLSCVFMDIYYRIDTNENK